MKALAACRMTLGFTVGKEAVTIDTKPRPTDLTHLSPLGWAHITLTGDYHWEVEPSMRPDLFRPLRTTDFAMTA